MNQGSLTNEDIIFLGSGKTTYLTLETIYKIHTYIKASELADMPRIPRKMKKKYLKNKYILKEYKAIKNDIHSNTNKRIKI